MVVLRRDLMLSNPPALSRLFSTNVTSGGVGMYCGAVEFVCSPSTVRHIPVLLDECMACLKPSRRYIC